MFQAEVLGKFPIMQHWVFDRAVIKSKDDNEDQVNKDDEESRKQNNNDQMNAGSKESGSKEDLKKSQKDEKAMSEIYGLWPWAPSSAFFDS